MPPKKKQSTVTNPTFTDQADDADGYLGLDGGRTLSKGGAASAPAADDEGYLHVVAGAEPEAADAEDGDVDTTGHSDGSTGSEKYDGFDSSSGSEGGTPPSQKRGAPPAAVTVQTYTLVDDAAVRAAKARAAQRANRGAEATDRPAFMEDNETYDDGLAPAGAAADPADDDDTYGGHVDLTIHKAKPAAAAAAPTGDADPEDEEGHLGDPAAMGPSRQVLSPGRGAEAVYDLGGGGSTSAAAAAPAAADGGIYDARTVPAVTGGPMGRPMFLPGAYAEPAKAAKRDPVPAAQAVYEYCAAGMAAGVSNPGYGDGAAPTYELREASVPNYVWNEVFGLVGHNVRAIEAIIKYGVDDTYATVDGAGADPTYMQPYAETLMTDMKAAFQTEDKALRRFSYLAASLKDEWSKATAPAIVDAQYAVPAALNNPFTSFIDEAELASLHGQVRQALASLQAGRLSEIIRACIKACQGKGKYINAGRVIGYLLGQHTPFVAPKIPDELKAQRTLPAPPPQQSGGAGAGNDPVLIDGNPKDDKKGNRICTPSCAKWSCFAGSIAATAVAIVVVVMLNQGGSGGGPDNSQAGPPLGATNDDDDAAVTTTITTLTTLLTTVAQSLAPTFAPTVPAGAPTLAPVVATTAAPAVIVTLPPTSPRAPTGLPTPLQTLSPSSQPTVFPTGYPTGVPTWIPTVHPSHLPTSLAPSSLAPSSVPTGLPTVFLTVSPTGAPTLVITTVSPTGQPTRITTLSPTALTTTDASGTTQRIDFTPAFNGLSGAQQNALCRGIFGTPAGVNCRRAASEGSKCCNVGTGWGCRDTCNN